MAVKAWKGVGLEGQWSKFSSQKKGQGLKLLSRRSSATRWPPTLRAVRAW